MPINNRSGSERRKQQISVGDNKRLGSDRRSLLKDPDKTIGRLRMVKLFDGLSSDQLQKLLSITAKRDLEKDEYLYRCGEESTDMFLLVRGKLKVRFPDGGESSAIKPSGLFGEIGIFTGEKRLVSVISPLSSTVLSFYKEELYKLFKSDTEMWITIQSNVIKYLYNMFNQDMTALEESRSIRRLDIS